MRPLASAGHDRATEQGLRATAVLKPLPWPPPSLDRRAARRPHAHRCLGCGARFDCPGPDESGFCAPVCAPCYWVELGTQLKAYEEVVAALSRKRREIEDRVGERACRQAHLRRRRFGQRSRLLIGFGRVMVELGQEGSEEG